MMEVLRGLRERLPSHIYNRVTETMFKFDNQEFDKHLFKAQIRHILAEFPDVCKDFEEVMEQQSHHMVMEQEMEAQRNKHKKQLK
mmetsp:Transcript_23282/g.17702  ORF Transcript_23282/g.17702 Transcript_23282/m.17702 type:complete len:85 (+) Transcript_23282:288-542(+)